ncbi:MAG: hypothetical protein KatS3mg019_0310 [Fimbriimonadales bacterium]|nr:MAG: hypothetical protein KatS3mg019_0310 [Fimbriimonadales bacterium]
MLFASLNTQGGAKDMFRFTSISQTRQGQVGKKRGRRKHIRSGICSLLTLNMLALLWCQPPERLQINFQTHLDLVANGDIPEGGVASYGWAACGSRSSCSLEWFESCFSFWARWGAGSGNAFSSSLDVTIPLVFGFASQPPTLSIEGYSYTPKRSLGFLYFVQNVGVVSADLIAAASCGPYGSPPPPCCATASSEAFFDVSVQTSLARASIAGDFGASCACGDAANCADCGQDLNEPPYPYDGWHQGYRSHQVSFADGITATHKEGLYAHLLLQAEGSLCGAAGGSVAGGAGAGLLLQSAPHPLGVPAIGENEYVWSSESPATLVLPARALGYTWGWEPDLSWIAEKAVFRVEPEILSDDTKPGVRTVARGRELVAQSLEGQTEGHVDDLLYRSKYLPPRNSDFGKKRVVFEVEGKVDYAEIEVFYPAEASNHPPSLKGVVEVYTGLGNECIVWGEVDTPNFFYYYSQVYPALDVTYALMIRGGAYGLTCQVSPGSRDTRIYVSSSVSPCWGELGVPLFRRVNGRIELVRDEVLYVRGIHKFVAVVEHERVHARLCRRGVNIRCNPLVIDTDLDELDDNFEALCGLDPTTPETVDGIPDNELIALLVEYGKVEAAKDLWKRDWATCGLQYGQPQSPFPYAFARNGVRYPSSRYNDLITEVPCLER